MQLVIPMSGFGERFRAAGYVIPKPLIQVEGKPIVGHVLDMFPNVENVYFVCNEDHLLEKSFAMESTLISLCPKGTVIPVHPHKLGPVHAALQAIPHLDPDEPVIVNYADFSCRWDFGDFLQYVEAHDLDGAVPAYRGFHPHSGGTTNYAYIRELEGRLLEIREKQPFTSTKTKEFASSGTYYFRTARIMEQYFRAQVDCDISVGGEYYASSSFDLMARDGLSVGVYEIEHFMQWGTPQDLQEYEYWSKLFHTLKGHTADDLAIRGAENSGILAAGQGSRFSNVGYQTPKALLRISGAPLLKQISRASQNSPSVLALAGSSISNWIKKRELGSLHEIDVPSNGQAHSAKQLISGLSPDGSEAITILAADTIFADNSGSLADTTSNSQLDYLVVWVGMPNPFTLSSPESFGWVGLSDGVCKSAIKQRPNFSGAMVLLGAFTFSSTTLFNRLYAHLEDSGILLNGESYLDSLVEIAVAKGITVELFEPTLAISLGTPYEFETFRYWQACFDRWDSHDYKLELDPFIEPKNVDEVRRELHSTKHRPEEWSWESHES